MTTPSVIPEYITIDITSTDKSLVIDKMITLVPLELSSQPQSVTEITSQAQRHQQKKRTMLNIARAIIIGGIVLCETPFVVSDFVYGYSNSECITSKLHTYYIVSAYVSLATCVYCIIVILSLREVLNRWTVSCAAVLGLFIVYVACIFHLIWDIYGVYCLYYIASTCLHKNAIMYGYVSVAIKLITGICVTMYFTINLMVN